MWIGGGHKGAAAADVAAASDPVLGVMAAVEGLGEVLDGLRSGVVESGELTGLLRGLGQVEAMAAAASARVVVAAEEARVPESDGATGTAAWAAAQLRCSGAEASRVCSFAVEVHGMPAVLAALEAGAISRAHATGLIAAARSQQAAHDAAEAARLAAEEDARRARAEADRRAAEQARTRAERARLERERAAREAEIARAEQRARAERAAAVDRATAERTGGLLDLAVSGAAPEAVRATAKRLAAADADGEALARSERAQWCRRSVRSWIDTATGMGHVHAELPAEQHERLEVLLQATRTLDDPDAPAVERRSFEQRQADALIDIIDRALATGDLPSSKGARPHLTVTVPLSTLTGEADEPARTTGGTWVSAEAVRRIACDGALTRAVLSPQGQVLDVGRETRQWTVAQHRAAELVFGGCAFPVADGQPCGRPPAWCDLHHVRYWSRGGRTDRDNAVLLCTRHHHVVHHPDWTLTYDHDALTVTVTREGRPGEEGVHRTAAFRTAARGGAGDVDQHRPAA